GGKPSRLRAMSGQAYLVGMRGAIVGRRMAVGATPVTIGRDRTCHFSDPNDAGLAPQHARVVATPGGFVVEDLGSGTGTFVNGAGVAGPTAIGNGDVVTAGGLALAFEQRQAAAPIGAPGGTVLRPDGRRVEVGSQERPGIPASTYLDGGRGDNP